jgi:hypothetical protein
MSNLGYGVCAEQYVHPGWELAGALDSSVAWIIYQTSMRAMGGVTPLNLATYPHRGAQTLRLLDVGVPNGSRSGCGE